MLNFGPINREGGERRLNVAVTRAKINVQLVSSMHYCDIDLSRTKSVGARLLREYLDYAENGVAADAFAFGREVVIYGQRLRSVGHGYFEHAVARRARRVAVYQARVFVAQRRQALYVV